MPEAEAQLAGDPPHVISGAVEEAVLALLRGVRDVGMRAAMSLPVAPLNAVRDNYLASDWHRILSAYHDDWELPENQTDDRRFALRRRLCEGANAIWAKPVRTWEDRIERAGTVGLRDARELPIQPDRAQEGRARVIGLLAMS